MNQRMRYQANPVVSCGAEEDGAVLYNPDTDDTSMVNLTGQELWSFLQTARSEGEIVDHLVRNYRDVSVEQATEDTKLFIESLVPDFLLEINDGN
jgi:hypothetical protein